MTNEAGRSGGGIFWYYERPTANYSLLATRDSLLSHHPIRMGFIDCHVHLYPPEVNRAPARWAAERGETLWATLCARVRKNGRAVQGFPSVDELLRAMDTAGVERAVLQGWYWEKHDTCVVQNRFYAGCIRRHPDRLSACATLHPAAGETRVLAELRWAREQGFCGLGELSPHSQQVSGDDPVWQTVLGGAAEWGWPVLLHVTEPAGKAYPGRVLTPLDDFVRWARQYPKTPFVWAHWGARLPLHPELGTEARALRNVYYDTAASPLLYDFTVFPEMVSAVGAERVMFGSDYPLNLFPADESGPEIASFLKKAQAQELDSGTQRAIFRENARAVFGLK